MIFKNFFVTYKSAPDQSILYYYFARIIWWFTISKAFYKSTKTLQPIFLSPRAFILFSVILIKA